MPQTKIYISDTNKYNVEYNNSILYGIKIMRAGTFNGVEYSTENFKTIIQNFYTLKNNKDYEPALKTMHTFDNFGMPENVSTLENTLGYITDLYLDGEYLIADIKVTQEDKLIPNLANKTLRYLSTEIYPYYTIDNKEVGMTLIGLSYVFNPAIKGLSDYNLIINSEQLKDMQKDFKPQNNSKNEGGNTMSLWEQLKDILSNTEIEEDPTQKVEEGETDETEVNEEEIEEVEEVETNEIETNEENVEEEETEDVETNEEEDIAEKYEEQLSEKDKRIAELEKAAINKDIKDTVDELAREGYLKPANKENVQNYLEQVYENEEVRGNFIEILKDNSDIPNKNKKSVDYDGPIQVNDEISDEEAESYAEKVMKSKEMKSKE